MIAYPDFLYHYQQRQVFILPFLWFSIHYVNTPSRKILKLSQNIMFITVEKRWKFEVTQKNAKSDFVISF